MTDAVNSWLAYWERVPEGCLLFTPESEEYARNFLREFDPKSTDRVLDYGCGFGQIARLLAPRVGAIRLWDEAENMRSIAAASVGACGNVGIWDRAEDGFDFILVNSVVQYLDAKELGAKVAEWAERLAPGGRIVLSDLSEPGHYTLSDIASLFRFSLRRGYLVRAARNTLAERRRYAATEQARPLYRPARDEIGRIAAAAGLSACYLAHNLTHFRGRYTAVLSPSAHATDVRHA